MTGIEGKEEEKRKKEAKKGQTDRMDDGSSAQIDILKMKCARWNKQQDSKTIMHYDKRTAPPPAHRTDTATTPFHRHHRRPQRCHPITSNSSSRSTHHIVIIV
ncbi:Uncharacterized protein BM_BM632 [Brugia malayi]|uniref:Bm632 n=2 Tax=Brugia TaxID=6278 RepID=A0A0K0JMN6_BRUMA|nr:Uncharacterized protein BM_BM632 [Brugia malayi]CDP99405.1 Bm632 [Brugia malayi]VIO99851.1 Uncharacterized protein BM_BM632 [Brugia malayi]